MALRGQGSLQELLGRSLRAGSGRPGASGSGSGGATSGSGVQQQQQQQQGLAAPAAPVHRQGDIKSFFAPRPKRPKGPSEAAADPAGVGGGAGRDGDRSGGQGSGSGSGSSPSGSWEYGVVGDELPLAAATAAAADANAADGQGAGRGAAPASAGTASAWAAAAAGAASTSASAWTLEARIVGRRHRSGQGQTLPLTPATRFALRREPLNPVDANAIQVVALPPPPPVNGDGGGDGAGGSANVGGSAAAAAANAAQHGVMVGHVPASVASQLAPLLDSGRVTVKRAVLVIGSSDRLSIKLAVHGRQLQAPLLQGEAPQQVAGPPDLAEQQQQQQQQQRQQQHGWTWDDRAASAKAVVASSAHNGAASAALAMAPTQVLAEAVQGVAAASAEHARDNSRVLVDAFEQMAARIRDRDAHLLDKAESELLTTLLALPREQLSLVLRLLTLKRTWHFVATLVSSEAECEADVPQQLVDRGLAVLESSVGRMSELGSLLDALSIDTLRAAMSQLLPGKHPSSFGSASANKAGLVASLSSAAPPPRIISVVRGLVGPMLRLSSPLQILFSRMQRLYFLTEGQDISAFSAAARGGVKWPKYVLDSSGSSVWHDRASFLAYEQALGHAAAVEDALQESDNDRAWECLQPALDALRSGAHKAVTWDSRQAPMPNPPAPDAPPQGTQDAGATRSDVQRPLFFARFTSGWIYASLGTVAASLLERRRDYQAAVELLQLLLGGNACLARRGTWWLRLSINLEHLKDSDAALEVAEAALADPFVRHGDRLALQRRVLRLGKPPRRWKRPSWAAAVNQEPSEVRIVGRPLPGSIGSRNRYYGYNGQQVSVEDLVLQHFARQAEGGWLGIHSEGGVWANLFGLCFWDVIFSDVAGVFQTPFQSAPLDLDTDAFFPARAAALEARLQEVALGKAPDLIAAAWQAHYGELCRGVSWSRLSLDNVLDIAECVGGVGLSVVFRLMAEDHSGNSGGLPDLLLWRLSPSKEARLLEVKGPTDRLSEQQRAWIACMASAGMQVQVCKVTEPA